MKLSELLDMDAGSVIEWLMDNQYDYELVSLTINHCPKCNSVDYQTEMVNGRDSVYCLNCGFTVFGEDQNDAVIRWNKK